MTLGAAPALAAGETSPTAPASRESAQPPVCAESVRRPWPAGLAERRARIKDLQRVRQLCIDDPPFLAALGALLLEDGEPEQALIWLERSLLLDPEPLGVQADHALTLAELGQPDALREMARQLRSRTDIPDSLRSRLYPIDKPNPYALPAVKLGHALRSDWGMQGEVSVLTGYEGNLDRSPQLDELTLTLTDELVVLPVQSQPRAGGATLAAAAIEVAFTPTTSTVLRTGLIVASRSASSEKATDWQQWQWSLNAGVGRNGLRAHVDYALAGIGGPLGEPYRLERTSLLVDVEVQACRVRLSLESERRIQDRTANLNSQIQAGLLGIQCPLTAPSGWRWQLDLRVARDRPESEDRPGGLQRAESAGLRLSGPIWGESALELGLRSGASRDALGYSPLLESNARRKMASHQLSVEYVTPVHRDGNQRLEAVVRWQMARQTSNLPIFRYRANSLYGGVRWVW